MKEAYHKQMMKRHPNAYGKNSQKCIIKTLLNIFLCECMPLGRPTHHLFIIRIFRFCIIFCIDCPGIFISLLKWIKVTILISFLVQLRLNDCNNTVNNIMLPWLMLTEGAPRKTVNLFFHIICHFSSGGHIISEISWRT